MARHSRKIIIDASMTQGGGGFTFVANVVPYLARLYPNDRFRVFARRDLLAECLQGLPNVEVEVLPPPTLLRRLKFSYLDGPRIAREWGADLYFSCGEYAPIGVSCPVMASFQNPNVFTSRANEWPLRQRLRLGILYALARLSATFCDRIHFVSRDSARWIGDAIALPEHKRAPIPHGIDASDWRPKHGLEERQGSHVLSVSSIYRYKNYVRLIEAWAQLANRRPDLPDLVIVGDDQDPPYARQMEAARIATGELAERIHIVGEVPYSSIRDYYQHAAAVVFPSYLETFGFPLIEAMASGTPLVASDMPVFRETAGDAAFYADPYDPASIAGAMEAALYAPGASEMLTKRGLDRVKNFTWERAAMALVGHFEEMLATRAVRARGLNEQALAVSQLED